MGSSFVNDWYIRINYANYRDYRIVRMADAQGVVREGIFIPFLQNGIVYDIAEPNKPPLQILKPYTYPQGILISKLIPYANAALRKKMLDGGVVSPNDPRLFNVVGHVYKDYEFINHKSDIKK